MHSPLRLPLIGFVLAGLVSVSPTQSACGQDLMPELKPYRKTEDLPGDARRVTTAMKDGRALVGGQALDASKTLFEAIARHYLYKVTQEQYYTAPDGAELKPRNSDNNLDVVFEDLRRYYMLVPNSSTKQMTAAQIEYWQYFGEALNATILELMKKNPPPLIRVNTARALSIVAAMGSPAFAKTITNLLNDPKTPPEVLLYAYKAADAFLAAYDPNAIGGKNFFRHTVQGPELIELVKALEKHVLDGPPVAEKVALTPPPIKIVGEQPKPVIPGRLENKSLTAEQVEVVRYFRRQAVRALAKCRLDTISNLAGQVVLRPASTLAKFAVNDESLYPEASPAEVAEAVRGLAEMPPSSNLNIDTVATIIATGIASLARLKNVNPADHSIPWVITSAKIGQSLGVWKASVNLFPQAATASKTINSAADVCQREILSKLEQTPPKPANVERVTDWISQNQPKDAKKSLFKDKVETVSPRPLSR